MHITSGWLATDNPEKWLKDQSFTLPHQLISHWGGDWFCEQISEKQLTLRNNQVQLTIKTDSGFCHESSLVRQAASPSPNNKQLSLSSIKRYGLVDSEGKQRVKLYFFSYENSPGQIFLLSQPMKGYENNYRKFNNTLLTRSDFFFTNTTSLAKSLELETPNHKAIQARDNKLWNQVNDVDIRRCELGHFDDIELLHKFRVSIRRTRSYLQSTVLDHQHLDKQLKRLVKPTNHLRDMDVFIENKKQLTKLVDNSHRPGLQAFFDKVKEHHHQNQLEIFKQIRGSKSLLQTLRKTKPQHSDPSDKQALESTHNSEKQIASLCQTCLDRINSLSADSDDEKIHQLRIKIKQLRYLIEIHFNEITPELQQLLKSLKPLQEHLGTFNDCCVQQQTLADLMTKLKINKLEKKSVSALIKQLGITAKQQKAQLVVELHAFSELLKAIQTRENT